MIIEKFNIFNYFCLNFILSFSLTIEQICWNRQLCFRRHSLPRSNQSNENKTQKEGGREGVRERINSEKTPIYNGFQLITQLAVLYWKYNKNESYVSFISIKKAGKDGINDTPCKTCYFQSLFYWLIKPL